MDLEISRCRSLSSISSLVREGKGHEVGERLGKGGGLEVLVEEKAEI
jgi:hypothetical protein